MEARGLIWLKTVDAFPFEENQSGIFHFGKPEACFPYENQGVYLLVVLRWHCAGNGLWYSLCIFWYHPGILLKIAIGIAPVIDLSMSA